MGVGRPSASVTSLEDRGDLLAARCHSVSGPAGASGIGVARLPSPKAHGVELGQGGRQMTPSSLSSVGATPPFS
jgi:hypothetical protein